MRIRRKFLQLTKWTYPYGTEVSMEGYLPKGFIRDENENYYLIVGENPTTMFTCHLDTSCSDQEKVTHVHDGNYIRTNRKTILGADDKAGMSVILYMIEKRVPGIYYFFVAEEVGCIGSSELAAQWESLQMFNNIKKIISFDRRGTDSVITHQLYGRCCSDEFATELSDRLNMSGFGLFMKPDDTGIMTDSAQFVELVPECTNISVGYYREHTVDECQDIEFLQRLCKSVVSIDWETLPVKRDPSLLDDYEYEYSEKFNITDYEFIYDNYTYIRYGQEIKRTLISKSRIEEEKVYIYQWLVSTHIHMGFKKVVWNGQLLYIENDRGLEYIASRADIMDSIPELCNIPAKHLSDRPMKSKSQYVDLGTVDNRYQREFLM